MNRILNVNIGGFAVTIDDDAFEYLSAYLDSIRRRFSASEGRDEIINDIEMRLGELLTAELGSRSIVMLPDVEAAVQIMGKPEDFGGEPIDNRRQMGGKTGRIRTGRRLFRDEEDKVAGGVCSGLAAYFGISDPVWMRLIFVLLTIMSVGFWVPAYVLLWVLVPPAKTAADRLAMRGEPINVDNIAREVEEGFDRISDQFSAKKKSGISEPNRGAAVLSDILSVVGRIFGFALQLFAKFGLLILIIVAGAIFLSLVISWIAGFWGLFALAPFVGFFSPYSGTLTFLGLTNVFLLLGLPVLGLSLVMARLLFKIKTPNWLGGGLFFFWLANLVFAGVLVAFTARDFRQSGTITRPVDLSNLQSDTLRVELAGDGGRGHYQFFDSEEDDIRINDDNLEFEVEDLVRIRVRQSNDDRFAAASVITARGATYDQARDNAAITGFSPTLENNHLLVPPRYVIPRGNKWRVQNVRFNIDVPVGKYIVFSQGINNRVHDAEYADRNSDYRIYDYPDQLFKMTDDGLVCVDCPNFGDRDYRSHRNYENFILEGNFKTEIRRGNRFRLKIEGDEKAIETIRTGDKLTLASNNGSSTVNARVIIETPVFTDLYANNSGDVVIRGFDEGRASITVGGNSSVKAYLDSRELNLTLNGPCKLELIGKGNQMDVSATDGAILEATAWRADRVQVNASGGANIKVYASDDAEIRNDGSAQVKVEGSANQRFE